MIYADAKELDWEPAVRAAVMSGAELSNEEWSLRAKYHNHVDGRTSAFRLKHIIILKENVVISEKKCRIFIRYCASCQGNCTHWLKTNRINIDRKLANVAMMDMYYSGDIDPKTKCGKVLHVDIALCSSRLLLMFPLKNRTGSFLLRFYSSKK